MPDAKLVVLTASDRYLPEFHRHAARLKAKGSVLNCGDKLIAYRVDRTVPEGPVVVTDSTQFVFSL